MIDTHCHLNFNAFKDDYDEVIKRAFEAGVTKIINVGTKIDSSQKAVELAEKYENLHAIVGIHPHHADKPDPSTSLRLRGRSDSRSSGQDWIDELEVLAKNPKVVAIGEIGMDYFRYKSNDIVSPKLQKEIFIKQIELAHRLKLPLQIHNRHAGKDILEILAHHKSSLLNPPGMFHCMSGSLDFLKKVLDLGFYIGFDGNITYEGLAPGEDTSLEDLVKASPINRIVVETDSPFLTPQPHRGSRNMPEYAILVGRKIAEIKNISFEKMEEKTIQNTNDIFKINVNL